MILLYFLGYLLKLDCKFKVYYLNERLKVEKKYLNF